MEKRSAYWKWGLLAAALAVIGWYLLPRASIQPPTLQQITATPGDPGSPLEVPRILVEAPAASLGFAPSQSESVRQHGEQSSWVRAVVDALLERGDADSLAVAALLMQSNPAEFNQGKHASAARKVELLDRAALRAPDDPLVQLLALSFCEAAIPHDVKCDRDLYGRRLRVLDPENALVWMSLLEQATTKGNSAEQVRALEGIAGAKRWDNRQADVEALVLRTVDSVREAPPAVSADSTSRPAQLLAAGARRTQPALFDTPLKVVCKSTAAEAVANKCREIVRQMRASNNTGQIDDAYRIAKELVPPDSAEAREIAAAQRRLNWRISRGLGLIGSQSRPTQSIETINDSRRLQAFLLEHGVPLDPPPEWDGR